ncbi:hypothetical protein GVAV_001469 [Gurleya vavrai]
MSATINTKKFEKYFNAVVYEIKGIKYKADVVYENVDDYIVGSYLKIREILSETFEKKNDNKIIIKNEIEDNHNEKKILKINEIDDIFDDEFEKKTLNDNILDDENAQKTNNNGILVFLPGEEDIHELYKMVKNLPQVCVFKIYSALSDEKQNQIFNSTTLLKVILSTNICETSLTIPGIKYVIDCGLSKEKIFNGINYLGIRKIGKDNADQRKGRCNRTQEGICYRLYLQETYNKMIISKPEIEKCDFTDSCLLILSLKMNILNFDYINVPNMENVKNAIIYLQFIGCITLNNEKKLLNITKYGKKLLKNPLDTKLSHFYEITKNYKIDDLGAILIGLISQEHYNFLNLANQMYKSDIETLLIIFLDYCESKNEKSIELKYDNIAVKALEKAKVIQKQLQKECGNFEMKKNSIDLLEKAFSEAFKFNLAIRNDDGSYSFDNKILYLHPSSMFFKKKIKKIVFVDLWCSTKNYARIACRYIQ